MWCFGRLARIEAKLDSLLALAREEKEREEHDMATTQEAIDDLRAALEQNTDVTASGVEAINRLADQIEQSKDDPEELAALAAALRQNSGTLGAAIARTTPPTP